jgi:hypothetical protein
MSKQGLAWSCVGGAGLGQVNWCDLCAFCYEVRDRFARLDPACPNDRARAALRCISDRCLSCSGHRSLAEICLLESDCITDLRTDTQPRQTHRRDSVLPSFFAHNPRVPFQLLLPRSRHHRHIIRIIIATAQDARENPHNDTCRNTFTVNAIQLGSHGSITPVDPHIPGSTTLDIQIKPQSCRILSNTRGTQCQPQRSVSLHSSAPGDHLPIDPSLYATRLRKLPRVRLYRTSSLLLLLLRATPRCRQRPTATATMTAAATTLPTAMARLQACVHSTVGVVPERAATQTHGLTNPTTK